MKISQQRDHSNLGHCGLEEEVCDVDVAEIEVRRDEHHQTRMRRVFCHVEQDSEAVLVVHINRSLVT